MRTFSLAAALMALGLLFSGCAGKDIVRLDNENKNLKSQIENLNKQMTAINGKIMESQKTGSDNQKKIGELERRLDELKRLVEENKAKLTAPPAAPAEEKIIMAPKVKVLSGDGRMGSARDVARRLKNGGYDVSRVDKAPRSNFPATIVYYGPDFQEQANGIADLLGGSATTRAMSWSSMFDIIVVTGRKP